MTGLDKWSSLKDTLFNPQTNADPFPELKELSTEELQKRATVGKAWLVANPTSPSYKTARSKYNWIIYHLNRRPSNTLTIREMLGYLLE